MPPATTGDSAAGIDGAAAGAMCASPASAKPCSAVWKAVPTASAVPATSIDMPVGDTRFTVKPLDWSHDTVLAMSEAAGP